MLRKPNFPSTRIHSRSPLVRAVSCHTVLNTYRVSVYLYNVNVLYRSVQQNTCSYAVCAQRRLNSGWSLELLRCSHAAGELNHGIFENYPLKANLQSLHQWHCKSSLKITNTIFRYGTWHASKHRSSSRFSLLSLALF